MSFTTSVFTAFFLHVYIIMTKQYTNLKNNNINPSSQPVNTIPYILSELLQWEFFLSAGLRTALLTFFTASNFILEKLSPRSHGATHLNCVIWLCLQDFLLPDLSVCRPGENTVGGRNVCK